MQPQRAPIQYLEAKLKSLEDMPDKFKCCETAISRIQGSQGLVRRLIFPLIINKGGIIGTCPYCFGEKPITETAALFDMSGFSEIAIIEVRNLINNKFPIHICLEMHNLDEVPKEI
jgi:hypothetical protein